MVPYNTCLRAKATAKNTKEFSKCIITKLVEQLDLDTMGPFEPSLSNDRSWSTCCHWHKFALYKQSFHEEHPDKKRWILLEVYNSEAAFQNENSGSQIYIRIPDENG